MVRPVCYYSFHFVYFLSHQVDISNPLPVSQKGIPSIMLSPGFTKRMHFVCSLSGTCILLVRPSRNASNIFAFALILVARSYRLICLHILASGSYPRSRNCVSSANCVILNCCPFLVLNPSRRPSFSTALVSASATSKNLKKMSGEAGQPCAVPHRIAKVSLVSPFALISRFGGARCTALHQLGSIYEMRVQIIRVLRPLER